MIITSDQVQISNRRKGLPIRLLLATIGLILVGVTATWNLFRNPQTLSTVNGAIDSLVDVTFPVQDIDQQAYPVLEVIDGDTIEVRIGQENKTIRLLGIDTPELHHPTKPVQCFAQEAKDYVVNLLLNQQVRLESDATQGDTDRYGRLLRYVYLNDDRSLNYLLVKEGYAHEYTYRTPYNYQQQFKQGEADARAAGRGLWGSVCNGNVQCPSCSTSSSVSSAAAEEVDISSCKFSCVSPDRDCSDFTSRAEAQEFFNCCLFNATNDPMNLDGNGVGDGITCESLP